MAYDLYGDIQIDNSTELKNTEEILSELSDTNEDVANLMTEGIAFGHSVTETIYNAIKEFSLKYPDLLFILNATDSESNDWITYFKNGKHQECMGVISYPEYNEALLK